MNSGGLDILSRETQALGAPRTSVKTEEKVAQPTDTPDPHTLLDSLQKKRELFALLDGYVDKADLGEMKKRLNEAIGDLEKIIEMTTL